MKKRDIKYIIKRIIIGVGIVFFVGFLNKCSVKAETLDTYVSTDYSTIYFTSDYNDKPLYDLKSPYSNNTYNYTNDFQLDDKSYIVLYNSNLDIYLYYFFRIYYNLYPVDVSDIKLYYDSEVGFYVYSYKCTNENDSQCDNGYLTIGGIQLSFILSNNSNLDYSSLTPRSLNKVDSLITNEYFYSSYGSTGINLADALLGDFEIYDTNLSSLYIDDTEIDLLPIPDYYTSIDMQDHAGVYFVPKNYSTVPTTQNSVGDIVIPFNYYYKGDFADGYFPLDDYNKIVFNLYNVVSREEFLYSESWFPYEQNIEGTTYDYYAYIIQNNDKNSFSQYHDSIIYYDSRYFDYYIIDDFSSYNNTISIIDKNGGNADIIVSINSSLKEKFKEGTQENDSSSYIGNEMLHALDNNVLGQYLEFITIPFNFLRSFTSSTCSPIEIPIPFVGGTITLPCISSVLSQFVPQLYNIIVIVVNGFLVYRITMRNIDTCTDVVKADDDKIEVIDL